MTFAMAKRRGDDPKADMGSKKRGKGKGGYIKYQHFVIALYGLSLSPPPPAAREINLLKLPPAAAAVVTASTAFPGNGNLGSYS